VNDVAPLRFERARFYQHFESGLGAEARHAFGKAKFTRRCRLIHGGESTLRELLPLSI
jgi:hypothetical protein